MNSHWIVVWDPQNEWWEGSLVDESRARQLEARGVALLPCMPELFKLAGVGGYAKRAWGAGWPLDYGAPRMACPLTIYMPRADDPAGRVRTTNTLYWKARIVPSDEVRARLLEGAVYDGVLRLAADSGQAGPLHAGLTPRAPAPDFRKLGQPDAHGGWTIGGNGTTTPTVQGFYNYALYGAAPGFRVVWLAATVAE